MPILLIGLIGIVSIHTFTENERNCSFLFFYEQGLHVFATLDRK